MTRLTKPLADKIKEYSDKELMETYEYYKPRQSTLSKDELFYLNLLIREIDRRGRICPKCKDRYIGYPAISRKDNKTEICPKCGQKEALDAWLIYKMWRDGE